MRDGVMLMDCVGQEFGYNGARLYCLCSTMSGDSFGGTWRALGTSLMAQMVKNLFAMWETWVQSLGRDDPLKNGMATHSNTLAWEIPLTGEPGGLQSMESQSRAQLSDWTMTTTTSGQKGMEGNVMSEVVPFLRHRHTAVDLLAIVIQPGWRSEGQLTWVSYCLRLLRAVTLWVLGTWE